MGDIIKRLVGVNHKHGIYRVLNLTDRKVHDLNRQQFFLLVNMDEIENVKPKGTLHPARDWFDLDCRDGDKETIPSDDNSYSFSILRRVLDRWNEEKYWVSDDYGNSLILPAKEINVNLCYNAVLDVKSKKSMIKPIRGKFINVSF